MNIFFLTETESGCYKWRGAIPAKYLRQRGHNVQVFTNPGVGYEAPDVIVIFRAHYVDVHNIVAWCKKRKIRVVFDTDDALDMVPRENINHRILQERLAVYDFLLESADVVTTTTETLAAHLREWNPNVAVLPNSVDPDEWTVRPRTGEPRVGWSGSATHFHDLAVALDAVREIQKRRPFRFVLQGICQDSSLEAFYARTLQEGGRAFRESPFGKSVKRFVEKLSNIDYEFHPTVEIHHHAECVSNLALSIGLAPLVQDSFNQYKSCIKYYEYAMSGAATLASSVLPYSLEVPTTAKNSQEHWKQKLEALLDADAAAISSEQRDWVLRERNMQKNVELWERAYQG